MTPELKAGALDHAPLARYPAGLFMEAWDAFVEVMNSAHSHGYDPEEDYRLSPPLHIPFLVPCLSFIHCLHFSSNSSVEISNTTSKTKTEKEQWSTPPSRNEGSAPFSRDIPMLSLSEQAGELGPRLDLVVIRCLIMRASRILL